jgi:hypothetical protein
VVVETAFADGDGAAIEQVPKTRQGAGGIGGCRIMRVEPGGEPDEARLGRGERRRTLSGLDRFADADDRPRAGIDGPREHRVAVGVERRIGEVRVTVDELEHRGRGPAAVGQAVGTRSYRVG